jgi:hypothetical protein
LPCKRLDISRERLVLCRNNEWCHIIEVHTNNTVIPQSPTVKYLGLHLDSRLTWAQHLAKKEKRKQADLKVKDLYWFIGRKSPALLESKVLLYKTIIKLIWTYGIELWGCASKSHMAQMHRSQAKILITLFLTRRFFPSRCRCARSLRNVGSYKSHTA